MQTLKIHIKSHRSIREADEVITVDHIDGDNYRDYTGKTVKVTGNVNLRKLGLTKLPMTFTSVSGDFDCSSNQLTSLEGAPERVSGYFGCDGNQLTSLEGAPKEVGVDFYCFDNQLTSLEGAPKEVGRGFDCSNNSRQFTEADVLAVSSVQGEIEV